MSRLDKLLVRMRANPRDVRIGDLLRVLRARGATVRLVRGSSHVVVSRGATRLTVPRPHGTDKVRETYVRQALTLFDLWEDEDDGPEPS